MIRFSLDQWLKNIQLFLLPPVCAVCQGDSDTREDLCQACHARLSVLARPCAGCALPLEDDAQRCRVCRHRRLPAQHCLAPLVYGEQVAALMHGFKYHGQLHKGRLLATLALPRILAYYSTPENRVRCPELMVPVPLHPWRLAYRGFNQALEVARAWQGATRLPLLPRALRRRFIRTPQRGLSAAQRRRNVRHTFVNGPQITAVAGRRVALVDDVVTTMSTTLQLARLLRQAGAAEVHVWALARALPPDQAPSSALSSLPSLTIRTAP